VAENAPRGLILDLLSRIPAMSTESLRMTWDHDLRRVRHELVDAAGWGPDNDGDESWAVTGWERLPTALQEALAPLIQVKLDAMAASIRNIRQGKGLRYEPEDL